MAEAQTQAQQVAGRFRAAWIGRGAAPDTLGARQHLAERTEDAHILVLGEESGLSPAGEAAFLRTLRPVIACGERRPTADFHVENAESAALADRLADARAIATALAQIPRDSLERASEDAYLRSLIFAQSRGGTLPILADRQLRRGIGYRAERLVASCETVLNTLAQSGYLDATLAEAAHACPQCQSFQMLLRDACPTCGSIAIGEEPMVHHFACGHQDRESRFEREGRIYICPKCRRELRSIGLDYDKPGMVSHCRGCGFTGEETAVRGRCLSCSAGFPAEDSPRVPLCDYALTERGVDAVFSGVLDIFDARKLLSDDLNLVSIDTLIDIALRMHALGRRREFPGMIFRIALEDGASGDLPTARQAELVSRIGAEVAPVLRDEDCAAYHLSTLTLLMVGTDEGAVAAVRKRLFANLQKTFDEEVLASISLDHLPLEDWLAEIGALGDGSGG
jgi:hypothetical protein